MERRATVLVIDDEPDIVEFVRFGLSVAGFEVVTASDRVAAIARVRERPVDVIVSDLKMPGMDGVEVIEALRRLAPCAPIVLATGYLSEETIARSLASGATDYLCKPYTIQDLLTVLERVLPR